MSLTVYVVEEGYQHEGGEVEAVFQCREHALEFASEHAAKLSADWKLLMSEAPGFDAEEYAVKRVTTSEYALLLECGIKYVSVKEMRTGD